MANVPTILAQILRTQKQVTLTLEKATTEDPKNKNEKQSLARELTSVRICLEPTKTPKLYMIDPYIYIYPNSQTPNKTVALRDQASRLLELHDAIAEMRSQFDADKTLTAEPLGQIHYNSLH